LFRTNGRLVQLKGNPRLVYLKLTGMKAGRHGHFSAAVQRQSEFQPVDRMSGEQ
jgi:hypothetical protein